MKIKILILVVITISIVIFNNLTRQDNFFHPEFGKQRESSSFGLGTAYAYPPAVGILSNSKNCLSCHVNNGEWKGDDNTIIDIIDANTKKSFRHPDGSFLIEVNRYELKTVLTIIGRKKSNSIPAPYRNAWLYIDPATIGTSSLSKFAPGWDVNLPMSCRVTGDKLAGYEDSDITSLPMTIQPTGSARDVDQRRKCKGQCKRGHAGKLF